MQQGKYSEPSVFTHFLPGILSGFVLGTVVSTIIIAHIATSSLQLFWRSVHADDQRIVQPCADVSGLRMSSRVSDTGSVLTSLTVGNGVETLLTVSSNVLRYVPSTVKTEAYLTAVASSDQQAAFPAVSLYRIDYCAQTITLVLGDHRQPVEILGVSMGGSWVIYMQAQGLALMQMQDRFVLTPAVLPSERPEEILFSPQEDAVALRYADTSRAVWSMGLHGRTVVETLGSLGTALPAWGVQSTDAYLAHIQ